MPVERVVDAFVAALPDGSGRRLAAGEWGVTLEPGAAGSWPLDIGIRVADGLLRIQAFAVPAANAPADADVLHWNRTTRLVRFARTRSGDVWVQADLPAELVDEPQLDRLLGLVAEAAANARGPSS
jgi:Putative bacterial sensory transduction regulator